MKLYFTDKSCYIIICYNVKECIFKSYCYWLNVLLMLHSIPCAWFVLLIENKTCFPCLHSLVKTKANVERTREQFSYLNFSGFAVEGFQLLENSHKLCRDFHQAMEARTCNMFYFFYKIIIFIVNKEKDDIRSAYILCIYLPCLSKVLKKLFYFRLSDFLVKYKILNHHQYGFR